MGKIELEPSLCVEFTLKELGLIAAISDNVLGNLKPESEMAPLLKVIINKCLNEGGNQQ